MDRKGFFAATVQGAVGCCALVLFDDAAAAQTQTQEDREETRVRVMAGCGRGCFRRFQFKQDIARLGGGSVEKLVVAYRKNFEVWREDKTVHVRYGAVTKACYCPAARYHPAKPNDLHSVPGPRIRRFLRRRWGDQSASKSPSRCGAEGRHATSSRMSADRRLRRTGSCRTSPAIRSYKKMYD
jgi:hypothetical protein